MAKKHSDLLIKEIRKEYESGSSISQLSKKYKVSSNTIKYWSTNNGWKKKKQNQPTANQKNKPTNLSKEVVGMEEERKQESLAAEIIEPVLDIEEAKCGRRIFSEKEKEFIRYYFLYRFNIKAATLKAGYNSETEGSRLLRKPKIKRAINLIRLAILERDNLNITPEYLIEELHANLLKASGELPQVKTFIIDKFDKETTPVTVRTFEGKLRDGTTVDGTEIYGELEKGSFKDVVKNKVNEKSYQIPEEFVIKDTDLKAVNMIAKSIADLYGYMDSSKLARERFEHVKEKYNDEKAIEVENENNSKNIITEIIGKADLNAKNNKS